MADIFDEINEELKQDRMTALWQRYGKYVIGFVAAVVAGVSLRQGYSYYTQKRDARSADVFFNAILSDDVLCLLLPADHEIKIQGNFKEDIEFAKKQIGNKNSIIFGVKPI